MEDNNKNIRATGWKSDLQPTPEPILIDDIDEEKLIIKKGDKE